MAYMKCYPNTGESNGKAHGQLHGKHTILGWYEETTPMMENRMEKMEHEMETAIYGVT